MKKKQKNTTTLLTLIGFQAQLGGHLTIVPAHHSAQKNSTSERDVCVV